MSNNSNIENNRLLSEQDIGDIILCEPITSRGQEALGNLGISTDIISQKYFYDNIRIPSKYETNSFDSNDNKPNTKHQDCLYFQYTSTVQQEKAIKEFLINFNLKFKNDAKNGYPILIYGVAGNGKSIDVNKRIWELNQENNEFERDSMYFDLDSAFSEIKYGAKYRCNNSDNALDLFSIKLFDGIMLYLRKNRALCASIYNNFSSYLVKYNIADYQQKELFAIIKNYEIDFNKSETELFEYIKNHILVQNCPEENIQELLSLLMIIMFCSEPTKKNTLYLITLNNILN